MGTDAATPAPFEPVGTIRAKRDGRELESERIAWAIDAYVNASFAEEQMAALLMAIFWRGLSNDELVAWTEAMIASGERSDLGDLGPRVVDKHSTGGVGDKVSLALVPLVAACGGVVPQVSGRGLGHTGGTLDKMESIPGWRAHLDTAEQHRLLETCGCMIAAATEKFVPADRKLYALRDITGTVESIPLIASSIMSKKIAEGARALLLDVKVGSGAFMERLEDARTLAETMVDIGTAHGVRTAAMLTSMDAPLGRAVGNAIEVAEAIDVLTGGGPEDLRAIVVEEARAMLGLVGIAEDPTLALADGRALERFWTMVRLQGGDPDAPLPQGARLAEVPAPRSGWVTKLEARAVGMAAWRLGAGRSRPGEQVSKTAGVRCLAKPGERVTAGQPVLALFGDNPSAVPGALAELHGAIEIGDEPPAPRPTVLERIGY
jgi:thymidine phosphorylase